MKLSTNGGNVPAQLLVLDGKNWERWHIQMKVLFEFQDMMEVVKNGVAAEPAKPATEAVRNAYKAQVSQAQGPATWRMSKIMKCWCLVGNV